jgi:hypothetical protein
VSEAVDFALVGSIRCYTILRSRKEVPWVVGMTVLESAPLFTSPERLSLATYEQNGYTLNDDDDGGEYIGKYAVQVSETERGRCCTGQSVYLLTVISVWLTHHCSRVIRKICSSMLCVLYAINSVH